MGYTNEDVSHQLDLKIGTKTNLFPNIDISSLNNAYSHCISLIKVFRSTLPSKLTYNLTLDVNPMKIPLVTDNNRASTVFGYTVEDG